MSRSYSRTRTSGGTDSGPRRRSLPAYLSLRRRVQMQVALKTMSAALGLIVPVLFISVLLGGVRRSPLTPEAKARFRGGIIGVVMVWLLCAWIASLTGAISHHRADVLPRWLVGLALPTAIGLIALSSKSFRTIVDSVPLQTLV